MAETFIQTCRAESVKTAIVLGSGLGGFADEMEVINELGFADCAEMPESTVPGHQGRFVLGRIGQTTVLAMQGRVHLYEGHDAKTATAGIRMMHAMGIETVILTNAAGTLNRANAPGTWMMLSDHINLTGQTPLLGGPNFVDMTTVYDTELRMRFRALASEAQVTLGEGVYAGLLGPQYETPAEIRMLAAMGADAVGMSTVLEAIQARALGMRVLGFSCLTNWAAGMAPGELDHSEVTDVGGQAAGQLMTLLRAHFSA